MKDEKIKKNLFGKKSYLFNVIIALLFVLALLIYAKLIPINKNTPNLPSLQDNITLFYEPDMGKEPIISGIKSAQNSIDIELYTFSDTDILSELKNAKLRGVKVRVILEENPYGGYSANKNTYDKLRYYGIDVKWDNKAYNFTHSKFLVIDNKTGYILTLNLTKSAFTKNREFGVITTDKKVIEELAKIFEADWYRKPYNIGSNSILVVSPENSRTRIETLLRSAHGEILMYAEEISDPAIERILKERRAYGAVVKIIIADPNSIEDNARVIDDLKRYGIDIKYVSNPFIHAKVIVVDEKYAFIGSENFSSNSLDNNREVGIITDNKEVIKQLVEVFSWDFGK
ncbi:MAG: hypothetical protein K6343_00955 [Caldisericaceae bacterium]